MTQSTTTRIMLRGRVARRAASSMAGQRRVAPGLTPNDGRVSLLLLQVQSDQAKGRKKIYVHAYMYGFLLRYLCEENWSFLNGNF